MGAIPKKPERVLLPGKSAKEIREQNHGICGDARIPPGRLTLVLDGLGQLNGGSRHLSDLRIRRACCCVFHEPAEPVLRVRDWRDLFSFAEVKFGIEHGLTEPFKNCRAVVSNIAIVLGAPSRPKVAP